MLATEIAESATFSEGTGLLYRTKFRRCYRKAYALNDDGTAGPPMLRGETVPGEYLADGTLILVAAPAKYEAEYTTSGIHKWVARDVP